MNIANSTIFTNSESNRSASDQTALNARPSISDMLLKI